MSEIGAHGVFDPHPNRTPLTPEQVVERVLNHLRRSVVVPAMTVGCRVVSIRDTLTDAHRIALHPQVGEEMEFQAYDDSHRDPPMRQAWRRQVALRPLTDTSRILGSRLIISGVQVVESVDVPIDEVRLRLDTVLP